MRIKKIIFYTVAFLTISAESHAHTCHPNLSYLESRLPPFGVSSLDQIRNGIFSTDIMDAIRAAQRQGFTASQAVQAVLDQAKEYDRSAREAATTASAVDALNVTDDEFLTKIRNGTLKVSNCDGIRNSSLCAAIMFKMGALSNRAAGAEIECYRRSGAAS